MLVHGRHGPDTAATTRRDVSSRALPISSYACIPSRATSGPLHALYCMSTRPQLCPPPSAIRLLASWGTSLVPPRHAAVRETRYMWPVMFQQTVRRSSSRGRMGDFDTVVSLLFTLALARAFFTHPSRDKRGQTTHSSGISEQNIRPHGSRPMI